MITIVVVYTKQNDLAVLAVKAYKELFDPEKYFVVPVIINNLEFRNKKVGNLFPTFFIACWILTNTKLFSNLFHWYHRNIVEKYRGEIEKSAPDYILSLDPKTHAGVQRLAKSLQIPSSTVILTPFTIHRVQLHPLFTNIFVTTPEGKKILKQYKAVPVEKLSWPIRLTLLKETCSCGEEIDFRNKGNPILCLNANKLDIHEIRQILKRIGSQWNVICLGIRSDFQKIQGYGDKLHIDIIQKEYKHRYHILKIADMYISNGDPFSVFDAFATATIPYVYKPKNYNACITGKYLQKMEIGYKGSLRGFSTVENIEKMHFETVKKRGSIYLDTLGIYSQQELYAKYFPLIDAS